MDAVYTGLDIRGLLKSSLNEWEGRVCAVVFTAHCNWRCPYCHGAPFVHEPESLMPIAAGEVFDLLRTRAEWIDGVAISGGEPTLQPGLIDFIRDLKKVTSVKLETNGTHPEVIEALLAENLLDCLCLDYKAPLDARLEIATHVGAEATALDHVKRSYDIARQATGIERETHTTLWPGMIDTKVLDDMAAGLQMPGALWVLQQYEPGEVLDPETAGNKRYAREKLDELEAIAKRHHDRVLLRAGKAQ